MSDEQVQTASADDLLSNLDLASVETEIPVIDKQIKKVTLGDIGKVELRTGRKGDEQKWFIIPFTLEEEATSVSGAPVPVGRKLRHRILVSPVGGLTQAMINEKLAKFQAAANGTKRAVNGVQWSSLSGKQVLARFYTRNGDDGRVNQEIDFMPLR